MPKRAVIFAVLLGSSSSAVPLSGQAAGFRHDTSWQVGYVANAPQQVLGIGAWTMPSPRHGWGLYADVKLSADSPAGDVLDRAMTPADAEQLGDDFFKETAAWTTVNMALVRGVSAELAVYLGGGVSWRTTYLQYVDGTLTRGEFGQYWVVDDELTGVRPNVLGGALFRAASRVVFQFGAEAAPAGVTVGVHLRLR
jgi:hypothetical protein